MTDGFYLKYKKFVRWKKTGSIGIEDLTPDIIRDAKVNGFSDAQIAMLVGADEDEIYTKRKSVGIDRVYKMVDTCSAEFNKNTCLLQYVR